MTTTRLNRDEKDFKPSADDPICIRPGCRTPKHHHLDGGQGASVFPDAECPRFLGPGASAEGRLEALELAYGGHDAIAKDVAKQPA